EITKFAHVIVFCNTSRLGPFAFVLLFSFQGSLQLRNKAVRGNPVSSLLKAGDEAANLTDQIVPVNTKVDSI
ncbi:MAG: hypothetical protein ABFR63_11935, partial [Thermodesulfobacteriota bacterium]